MEKIESPKSIKNTDYAKYTRNILRRTLQAIYEQTVIDANNCSKSNLGVYQSIIECSTYLDKLNVLVDRTFPYKEKKNSRANIRKR